MTVLRSCLFAPASSERLLLSATSAPADLVIIDLEDSVPAQDKESARRRAIDSLLSATWTAPRVSVRVNAWDTEWLLADVSEIVRACGPRLDAVLLPKTHRALDVLALDRLLEQLERGLGLPSGRIRIDALIEDAEGLEALPAIASAGERLRALCFGAVDFTASMGFRGPASITSLQWPARSAIVRSARCADKIAIDGPFTNVRDVDACVRDMTRSASEGFDGRLLIHPSQIEIAHAALRPADDDLALAGRIVESLSQRAVSGAGVAVVDGVMVDVATHKWAARILAKASQHGHADVTAGRKGSS